MPTSHKLEIFVTSLLVAGLIVYATTERPWFAFLHVRDVGQGILVVAPPPSETKSTRRERLLMVAAARLVKGDTVTSANLTLAALPESWREQTETKLIDIHRALYRAHFVRREIAVFRGHDGIICSAAFLPDGLAVSRALHPVAHVVNELEKTAVEFCMPDQLFIVDRARHAFLTRKMILGINN